MIITHTVSVLELAWTLIALTGLIFVTLILNRARCDYSLLLTYELNGLRKYVAITNILIFLGGTLTQISYMVVGIVGMTQPSLHNVVTTANIVNGITFVSSSLLSSIFAGVIWRRRVKIVNMLLEQGEKHHDNDSSN